ncbi:MAG: glycosyl transferase family protein [Pseudomonadales bacterium]|nr:glycosyl transferase family protein [Pseudomonadales bacterium]
MSTQDYHNKEHPFAQYVRILGKGKKGSRSLSFDEAYTAFTAILRGEIEDVQLGAFLMLLRVKEESADEIAGFVQACKDHIDAPNDIQVDIDWSSYAGKRKQLPWFIASLLILADNGYRIFIHAAKGHTQGRLYTEDAFTTLGLPIASNWQMVNQQLAKDNLSLMSVEHFCPELDNLLNMRNLLGLRSPVHTLSRLINPLEANHSFQSIFHPAYGDTHQQAAAKVGQRNMIVFKGDGGEIERKSNASCIVKGILDGELFEEKWPRLQEGKDPGLETLDMQLFTDVWRGETHDRYGETAIISTLAVVLKLLENIGNQEQAMEKAQTLWLQRNKNRLV